MVAKSMPFSDVVEQYLITDQCLFKTEKLFLVAEYLLIDGNLKLMCANYCLDTGWPSTCQF